MIKAREMLKEFSNFKIDAEKLGAVSIYREDAEGKREDVALIYKPNGAVQTNSKAYNEIPHPNKIKFHEVIKEIQHNIEDNRK